MNKRLYIHFRINQTHNQRLSPRYQFVCGQDNIVAIIFFLRFPTVLSIILFPNPIDIKNIGK